MRRLTRWGRVAAIAAMIAVAAVAVALAQGEKPKIALYISGDNLKPADKNILTRKFLSPFTASGMYSVIDRSDVFSQKIDQERKKQRDGSVSDSMIYVIGHEAGAKYVCMVELDYGLGRWNVGARMVDVVTAEIYLNSGDADIKGKLEDADFDGAAKTVFDKIHGKRSGSAAQTAQYQAPTPTPLPPPLPLPKPQSFLDGSGILTDSRDGKKYRTAVIGGKRWMAENLNYEPQSGNSWCYDDNSSNCNKYGRLYDWNTARTVCPSGFHLPSAMEWDNLTSAVGGTRKKYKSKSTGSEYFGWANAGTKLKTISGWNNNGNGADNFGFSALPGGYRYYDGSKFNFVGFFGEWWTATENDASHAYNRTMNFSDGNADEGKSNKSEATSVRCVAD